MDAPVARRASEWEENIMSMRSRFRSLACGLGAGVAVAAMAMGASPASAETFKIGIVTFLMKAFFNLTFFLKWLLMMQL